MPKEVFSNPLTESLASMAREATQKKEAETIKVTAEKKQSGTPVTSSKADGWKRFCDYAQQYNEKEGKSRGVTVWIDEDVKAALDKIKSNGACNVPVRHLVSAAIRTFIEEHRDEIKKEMDAKTAIL